MRKIVLLTLIVLTIFVQSCRSKKKIVEREAVKIEKIAEVKKEETTVKDVKTDSVVKTKSETLIITEKKDIELTQGDPNKEIVIIDPDGKKTVYKGANVRLRNSTKVKQKVDTSSTALTKIDKSKIDKSETIKTEEKTESKKRSTDSDVKTTPTMLWVAIGIGALGFVIFWYIRRKKRMFLGR